METIHESEAHKEESNKEIHTCNVCGKNFSYNSSLIKHVRIHTGERPYTCNFEGCSQKFSQVSNLIRHKRIHSGVKPYKCNYCNKNFSSSSNLKQHLNIHKNVIKRKKFPCFIQKCDKSYLYICTLKKHILNSHMEEYDQLKAEFPDRTFYDIFKELRTNNKFPFVDFKFFESTNDLTNNQENIYDFNLENNINLNQNFKLEDNPLFLNLAGEQVSGKLPFNGLGGFNNLINANSDILSLNNLLCNLKTRNIGLPSNPLLQGNLNADSFKLVNDLNTYLNLIQIQQAQQNSQIAQNQNQNLLLQSLIQAMNVNNPLASNSMGNNQINNSLTSLLASAAASNASNGTLNSLNFLAQLNNLGSIPNVSNGMQNNFMGGNLNSLNNISNMQNSPQNNNIPNLLNLSQKFMNTINNNQSNINNGNNSPFHNFGEIIKNSNSNNNTNNSLQAGNGVLNSLPCLGNLSKINYNNSNENFQNYILENKPKADILKTTLNNNDIMNNFTNLNPSYLSGLNSIRDQQNINDFINKYSNINQIGLENTYSQPNHTFPHSQMSSTNINYK